VSCIAVIRQSGGRLRLIVMEFGRQTARPDFFLSPFGDARMFVTFKTVGCLPPNQQLQRTVIQQRVRAAGAALPLCACGAHDTSSRGR
jgi:hypothetical protein